MWKGNYKMAVVDIKTPLDKKNRKKLRVGDHVRISGFIYTARDAAHKRIMEALEEYLLEASNALGIGPMGLGGINTVLGVNVEVFPTHIAGLPVAVNITCYVNRHVEREL
jgi:hypothetical protein